MTAEMTRRTAFQRDTETATPGGRLGCVIGRQRALQPSAFGPGEPRPGLSSPIVALLLVESKFLASQAREDDWSTRSRARLCAGTPLSMARRLSLVLHLGMETKMRPFTLRRIQVDVPAAVQAAIQTSKCLLLVRSKNSHSPSGASSLYWSAGQLKGAVLVDQTGTVPDQQGPFPGLSHPRCPATNEERCAILISPRFNLSAHAPRRRRHHERPIAKRWCLDGSGPPSPDDAVCLWPMSPVLAERLSSFTIVTLPCVSGFAPIQPVHPLYIRC